MRFTDQVVLTHPLEVVFQAFRDRLTELVPYLPAIESIETVEREDLGPGRVRLANVWQGNRMPGLHPAWDFAYGGSI